MTIGNPIPFASALARHAARRVMPTALKTSELQQLDKAVRQRAFFSAQTLMTDLLDGYKARIAELVDGTTDVATVRLAIKDILDGLGYEPDPAKRDTIQDLSSDKRIELVLKTNTEIAQNYGRWRQGQDPDILDQWPAQELYRLEGREEERDWLSRWRLAGQQTGDPIGTGWTVTTDGRMIALKNHAIWDTLGSTELWDDGLDNPYPPYAFNSGMDVKDVDRAEAEALGLIDRNTRLLPETDGFELPAELTQEAVTA